jgi:hypothetical protein
MRLSFRTQMDLFSPKARIPQLTDSERQKAVALLQLLLTEAATNPADVPLGVGEREAGNE